MVNIGERCTGEYIGEQYTVRALANLYLNFSKYISETMSKISISFEAEREGNVYRLVEKS